MRFPRALSVIGACVLTVAGAGVAGLVALLFGFGGGQSGSAASPEARPAAAPSSSTARPDPAPKKPSPSAARNSPSPSDEPESDEPSEDEGSEATEGTDCYQPARTVKIPYSSWKRQADGTFKRTTKYREHTLAGYNTCGHGAGTGAGSGSVPGFRGPPPTAVPTDEAARPGVPGTGKGGVPDYGSAPYEDNRVPLVTPHDRLPDIAPVRPPAPRAPRVPFVF